MINNPTVKYKGQMLCMQHEVMDELNLTDGQDVNEELFWKCIELNAINGIAKCKAQLSELRKEDQTEGKD